SWRRPGTRERGLTSYESETGFQDGRDLQDSHGAVPKSIRRRSANSPKLWGSAPNNPVNPVNPEILSSCGDQWGQSRLKPGIGNREWGIDKAIRPLPPPPDFINSRKSASPFPIPNDSPFPIADSQGEGGGEWERQS